ncbi:MAG TPA: hypothetical protein VGM88_20080 [Kofleriaceae bacterium]|jgi:hypothetical protein
MKNRWTQTQATVAEWRGRLARVPDDLVALVEEIDQAGRELETRIAPWRRDVRGEIAETGRVEVFPCGVAASRIAHYDANGQTVETYETSMGALIARLGRAMDGWTDDEGHRAAALRFAPLETRSGTTVIGQRDQTVSVTIAIHTDIWMPFVFAQGRYHDNRALAQRHTPRLNEYLRRVAASFEHRGGAFGLTAMGPYCQRWVHARGVYG